MRRGDFAAEIGVDATTEPYSWVVMASRSHRIGKAEREPALDVNRDGAAWNAVTAHATKRPTSRPPPADTSPSGACRARFRPIITLLPDSAEPATCYVTGISQLIVTECDRGR
jgi:hypothetical protein